MASHPAPSPSPPASASPPARKRPRPTAAAEDDPRPGASAASPAGFIFMCSGATKPDCYRHRVLGLPWGRLAAVSRIRSGAAVFLYDFDARRLHGPYRADSHGGLDLVPDAFRGRFPAQVKFKIDGDFMPLSESSLRRAIKENYSKGKFRPELTSIQVEKLRALFQPITLLPESSPLNDVDNWPPASAYLPPSASHPQPAAYAHHPTAYVAPPAAHSMPPEAYAPPCSYMPPRTAQPTTHAYCVATGYGYQAGYAACGPFPSTYQYVQAPPSCSLNAQYSTPAHVSAPVYSTGPFYAAYQNDPYQLGNVNSHYQQSTYERATYGAGHGMAATNLQLVRQYGSTPSNATNGTTHSSEMNRSQQAATYTAHAAGCNADGAASANYYASAPVTSPVNNATASLSYAVAAAPAY